MGPSLSVGQNPITVSRSIAVFAEKILDDVSFNSSSFAFSCFRVGAMVDGVAARLRWDGLSSLIEASRFIIGRF